MGVELNTWILLVIAITNAGTGVLWFLIKQDTLATKIAAELTEKNTNSMKDALVLATDKAAHAAGKEEGRVEGEAKAAVLAEGKLQGKE